MVCTLTPSALAASLALRYSLSWRPIPDAAAALLTEPAGVLPFIDTQAVLPKLL
jgi:hypothetical protein